MSQMTREGVFGGGGGVCVWNVSHSSSHTYHLLTYKLNHKDWGKKYTTRWTSIRLIISPKVSNIPANYGLWILSIRFMLRNQRLTHTHTQTVSPWDLASLWATFRITLKPSTLSWHLASCRPPAQELRNKCIHIHFSSCSSFKHLPDWPSGSRPASNSIRMKCDSCIAAEMSRVGKKEAWWGKWKVSQEPVCFPQL